MKVLIFCERDILHLHEMMMAFAGHEYEGQYKTDDNVILEIDTDRNRCVRFRSTLQMKRQRLWNS